MNDDDELKLELLKIAAREEMCGGHAGRAVEIAEAFWLYLRPSREAASSDAR